MNAAAPHDSLAEPGRKRARGPSPQKTAATRRAIVEAALAEFLQQGFEAATTADVARRAGLAKGTVFRYFATKESLFEAVLAERISAAAIALEAATLGEDERVGDFLRRALLPAVRGIETSGRAALARLVLAEGRQFPFVAEMYRRIAYEPLQRHVLQLADIAHARGELPGDALQRMPQLLLAPVWLAIIHNGVLAPDMPVDAGDMLEAQIGLIFGPASGLGQAAAA